MRPSLPWILGFALLGCRADVEGWWAGNVGGAPRTLRLEQKGSALEGELCSTDLCTPVRGDVEEGRVELTYGCAGCAVDETDLDLVLSADRLEGEASIRFCACIGEEDECTCRVDAAFQACDGPC